MTLLSDCYLVLLGVLTLWPNFKSSYQVLLTPAPPVSLGPHDPIKCEKLSYIIDDTVLSTQYNTCGYDTVHSTYNTCGYETVQVEHLILYMGSPP